MSSYTKLLYHIIWATKYRRPVMRKEGRGQLYAYMAGVLKNKDSHALIINGIEDHIHVLAEVHQSHSIASIVAHLKRPSSKWISETNLFPGFVGWQNGYAAFTVPYRKYRFVYRYIERQEIHHCTEPLRDEYKRFLMENNVAWKEEYLWE